jgi:hypothetical protein
MIEPAPAAGLVLFIMTESQDITTDSDALMLLSRKTLMLEDSAEHLDEKARGYRQGGDNLEDFRYKVLAARKYEQGIGEIKKRIEGEARMNLLDSAALYKLAGRLAEELGFYKAAVLCRARSIKLYSFLDGAHVEKKSRRDVKSIERVVRDHPSQELRDFTYGLCWLSLDEL